MRFSRCAVALCLVVFCFLSSVVQASRHSVLPGRTGGPANGGANCRSCHGNNVGSGSVEILGAPTSYRANEVYDLVVRVSDPDKAGAGFQISVEDSLGNHIGTLSVLDAVNTTLNGDDPVYLNHTSSGVDASVTGWVSNGNSASFPVRWTAPSTDMGTVTFYAAGNAINNNSSAGGDNIYLTSRSASFQAIPAASTWGIVVLSLGVMIAGSLVSAQRRVVVAPIRVR